MRRHLFPILTIALAAGFPLSATAAEGVSFFEPFDGFNPRLWAVSDGWVNGTWMNCVWSKRAVSVNDGFLTLDLEANETGEHAYRCGEIRTREKYQYGTYEVRLRTGRGSGQNAAFFTYTGPQEGDPHDEIDIEVLLKDPDKVSFNTYVSAKPANGQTVTLPKPSDDGFQTLGFTWTPDSITWFVEGREVHRTAPGSDLPDAPQNIFASLWSSSTFTDWMGPFDPSAVPSALAIDWIAFTALGDDCQFDASLLCETDR